MRKKNILSIAFIIAIFILSGCSKENISQESDGEISKTHTPEVQQAPINTQDNVHETTLAEKTFYDIQESADNGSQAWRLNPEDVAFEFATQALNFEGTISLSLQNEKESASVIFIKQSGEMIHINLYQPAVKGQGGIWEVECWFDENNRLFQIRDLTALPPLFYNDENVPQNIKEAVRNVVLRDWTETFGKYYNVLGFYANDVSYIADDDMAEVKFLMTTVTQNFYKDPDTVGYIREAKENGSELYQRLYDEYNMPKIGNVDLKVTMSLDASGEVLLDTIQVFNNVSVTDKEEYVAVKAADFIINE